MRQAQARRTTTPSLITKPDRVALATARRKLVFTRSNDEFVLTTFVRDGAQWRPMFDAGKPLFRGTSARHILRML